MTDLKKIAPLFEGWEENDDWVLHDGSMGNALCDNEGEFPALARTFLGDCAFCGAPNDELSLKAGSPFLVPQSEAWCESIERAWGERVQKRLRYSIKKEPDVFNTAKLTCYANSLPDGFSLRLFDEAIVRESFEQS
jgi:hypothetical protein